MSRRPQVLAQAVVLAMLFGGSFAINCYQCSGTDNRSPFQCNEFLNNDIDIQPEACDNVYDAKYCIKHVGRYEAFGIYCYQCSSSEMLDCADSIIHFGGLQPQNCNHVFEAQYCIKSTGLAGGIGTKRFCSSVDLGNYCNFVRQPGDILEYRTCIHTCAGDGCNSSGKTTASVVVIFAAVLAKTVLFS